jgi:hypothetical protein
MKLSLCIIVKNEAANLPRCLASVVEVSITPAEIEQAVYEFAMTVEEIEKARLNRKWEPAKPGFISKQDCNICDLRWDCPTPNITLRYP